MALFAEEYDKKAAPVANAFSDRVLALALEIPEGRVSTYGAIAKAAGGGRMAAQSVTGILGKAWDRGQHAIPFHRIVYSDGRIWIDDAHRRQRMALYKKEGIEIDEEDRVVHFRDILYEF